jgi:hypothetical protein
MRKRIIHHPVGLNRADNRNTCLSLSEQEYPKQRPAVGSALRDGQKGWGPMELLETTTF